MFFAFLGFLLDLFKPRAHLALENLALRQQLIVYERVHVKRKLPIGPLDRFFWVLLFRFWKGWRRALLYVRPETILKWNRAGFRIFWRFKCGKPGRPGIPYGLIALIRRMSRENPGWGEDRIEGELLKLGISIAPSTIRKYMVKRLKPPSQTWRTFLRNHSKAIWACDFFTTHTVFFSVLYVFFFIGHDRRRIIHVAVTAAPSSDWTARQYMNAILEHEKIPRFLLRDRDSHYGAVFKNRSEHCGTRNLLAPRKAPKFNAIAERLVRTVRYECLDHVLVFGEKHLLLILKEFVAFYNSQRPHQGIGQKTPIPKRGAIRKKCKIVSIPVLNCLQHYYEPKTA